MLNFVAIDFETATRSRNSACSLAAVTVRDGQIVKEGYSLIHPPSLQFDPACIEVHGIQPEEVKDKPTFDKLWAPLYQNHLHGLPIVAHNARFDVEVLQATLQHYQLDWPNNPYACTVKIARKVWPELPNHRLNTVGQFLDITFQHHQALDDARTCAKIVIAAAKQTGTHSLEELLSYCGLAYEPFIKDAKQVQSSLF